MIEIIERETFVPLITLLSIFLPTFALLGISVLTLIKWSWIGGYLLLPLAVCVLFFGITFYCTFFLTN